MYVDCFWFSGFCWSVLSVEFFSVVLGWIFPFSVFSSVVVFVSFLVFVFVLSSVHWFSSFGVVCVCVRVPGFFLMRVFVFVLSSFSLCILSWFSWLLSAAGLDGAGVAAFWLCFCGCPVIMFSIIHCQEGFFVFGLGGSWIYEIRCVLTYLCCCVLLFWWLAG